MMKPEFSKLMIHLPNLHVKLLICQKNADLPNYLCVSYLIEALLHGKLDMSVVESNYLNISVMYITKQPSDCSVKVFVSRCTVHSFQVHVLIG